MTLKCFWGNPSVFFETLKSDFNFFGGKPLCMCYTKVQVAQLQTNQLNANYKLVYYSILRVNAVMLQRFMKDLTITSVI